MIPYIIKKKCVKNSCTKIMFFYQLNMKKLKLFHYLIIIILILFEIIPIDNIIIYSSLIN